MHEGQEGEGGVAEPAVTIIPVPHPPNHSGSDVVGAATIPPVGAILTEIGRGMYLRHWDLPAIFVTHLAYGAIGKSHRIVFSVRG
jgi:hypothetical protein